MENMNNMNNEHRCEMCGSTLFITRQMNNSIGLFCDKCDAWVKWLGKDEVEALRAFEYTQTKINSTAPCIICGEQVLLTDKERYTLNHGRWIDSKICDKCKKVVLHLRELMKG